MILNKKWTYIFMLFSFSFISCNKENAWDCVKTAGETTTQVRYLTDFEKIVIYDKIDVFLIADSISYVEVKSGKNIIPKLTTEIENNELTIKNENRCNWVRSFDIPFEVYVHYTEISQIDARGAGNIISTNTIVADRLLINAWESVSTIDIDIQTDYFKVALHTGNADLNVSGNTNEAYFYVNPNGYLNALGLESDYLSITSNSPADSYVRADGTFIAVLNYVGNVFYAGNPNNLYIEENHSGKCIALD
jgi:hypothetical protein